jgi:hypothetical protein
LLANGCLSGSLAPGVAAVPNLTAELPDALPSAILVAGLDAVPISASAVIDEVAALDDIYNIEPRTTNAVVMSIIFIIDKRDRIICIPVMVELTITRFFTR